MPWVNKNEGCVCLCIFTNILQMTNVYLPREVWNHIIIKYLRSPLEITQMRFKRKMLTTIGLFKTETPIYWCYAAENIFINPSKWIGDARDMRSTILDYLILQYRLVHNI